MNQRLKWFSFDLFFCVTEWFVRQTLCLGKIYVYGADDPDHADIKAGGGVEWKKVMNDLWVGDKKKHKKVGGVHKSRSWEGREVNRGLQKNLR